MHRAIASQRTAHLLTDNCYQRRKHHLHWIFFFLAVYILANRTKIKISLVSCDPPSQCNQHFGQLLRGNSYIYKSNVNTRVLNTCRRVHVKEETALNVLVGKRPKMDFIESDLWTINNNAARKMQDC